MYNETIKFIKNIWNEFLYRRSEYEKIKYLFDFYSGGCKSSKDILIIPDTIEVPDEFYNYLLRRYRICEEKYEESLFFFNQACDFWYCRTHLMKHIKGNIYRRSYEIFQDEKRPEKYAVHSQMLDGAIKEACENFSTSSDLFLKGKIKKFSMKTKGYRRKTKTLEIDKR